MKTPYLIIGIILFSSKTIFAQSAVIDVAAVSALQMLLMAQKKEQVSEEIRHRQRITKQTMQHSETLSQWSANFARLKEHWKVLDKTRGLINEQLGFIKQLQNATGNPVKLVDLTFRHIDKEIFSRGGLVDDISGWLKKSENFSEWGKLLEELFKPFDINKLNSDELEKSRLERRKAIDRAYREAEALHAKTRTLQQKLVEFIQGVRVHAGASTTLTGMQKVGLHLAVTEKGMRSAMEIGEDLARRLGNLKTRADNRDVLEDEAERQECNKKHKEAAERASIRARITYDDIRRRRRPRNHISAGVSIGNKGKIKTRTSMRVNVPIKMN